MRRPGACGPPVDREVRGPGTGRHDGEADVERDFQRADVVGRGGGDGGEDGARPAVLSYRVAVELPPDPR